MPFVCRIRSPHTIKYSYNKILIQFVYLYLTTTMRTWSHQLVITNSFFLLPHQIATLYAFIYLLYIYEMSKSILQQPQQQQITVYTFFSSWHHRYISVFFRLEAKELCQNKWPPQMPADGWFAGRFSVGESSMAQPRQLSMTSAAFTGLADVVLRCISVVCG